MAGGGLDGRGGWGAGFFRILEGTKNSWRDDMSSAAVLEAGSKARRERAGGRRNYAESLALP